MKKNQKHADFAALEERYDAGFSQYIADQIDSAEQREINILDIKEINDLVAEYRARIRELIDFYRATQKASHNNGPLMRRVYANHETILIHRQIADLRKLYRMAWADSRELTEIYLERLKTHALYQMTEVTKHNIKAT